MMITYVVRPGDHLAKIAHDLGADADVLWEHPKNKDLRDKRGDKNILAAGDVLFVPVEEDARLPLVVGEMNRYSATVPTLETHLQFADGKGPFAGEAYVVEGLDESIEGSTDGQGKLTIEAPVSAHSAVVRFVKRGLRFHVSLGELDPVTEISGVQARLVSLGFLQGVASGELDEPTAEALRAFQKAKRIAITGAADAVTQAAVKDAYGC